MSNTLPVREREQKNKVLVFQAQKQFEASNEYKMNFNREAGFAIQILTQNEFLANCEQQSIVNSVVNVSLTGLTLNPALKYTYLIPRNGKCILDISYIGMIKILTDAGAVKNIDAGVIYSNDKYDFRKGSDPYFKHQNALSNRGEKIGAYAIAFLRDGGFQFEILGKDEIPGDVIYEIGYRNEEGIRLAFNVKYLKNISDYLHKYVRPNTGEFLGQTLKQLHEILLIAGYPKTEE